SRLPLIQVVSGVSEEVCTFVGLEGGEGAGDSGFESLDGAGGGHAYMRLELGEAVLDRIEVGTVGRQIEQDRIDGFDGLTDAGHLVGREIVHDDDIIRLQERAQHLLAPGKKASPSMGPSSTIGA